MASLLIIPSLYPAPSPNSELKCWVEGRSTSCRGSFHGSSEHHLLPNNRKVFNLFSEIGSHSRSVWNLSFDILLELGHTEIAFQIGNGTSSNSSLYMGVGFVQRAGL